MKYNRLFYSILEKLKSLLSSSEFLDSHRFPNHFVRKGKLTIFHLVMYLLNCSRQAMHCNMDKIWDIEKVGFPNVTKQAISKARQGINSSLFQSLFRTSVDEFYKNVTNLKKWHGDLRVFAIDGSRLEIPSSLSNFSKFGEMFSKKNPNRRWSLALASTILDVCNDFIVDGIIMPYLSSERAAAISHCEHLESLKILKGSVLLFDRGYYSEDMFRYFSSNGYMCVMRLKEGIKLSKNCGGDTIQSLCSLIQGEPSETKVRVIRIDLSNGTTEYLATNLFDKKYTVDDFRTLYFLRWKLEGKYYELKTTFRMEEFNGATSIAVEQEFFITLLYSNLASLIKANADEEIKKNANPNNKHKYQSNRSYIIGRLKECLVPTLAGAKIRGKDAIARIFRNACKHVSQIQPGRSSERKHVKRERTHFRNRKTAV